MTSGLRVDESIDPDSMCVRGSNAICGFSRFLLMTIGLATMLLLSLRPWANDSDEKPLREGVRFCASPPPGPVLCGDGEEGRCGDLVGVDVVRGAYKFRGFGSVLEAFTLSMLSVAMAAFGAAMPKPLFPRLICRINLGALVGVWDWPSRGFPKPSETIRRS